MLFIVTYLVQGPAAIACWSAHFPSFSWNFTRIAACKRSINAATRGANTS